MRNQLNTVEALYGKVQAMKKRVDLLKENTNIDSMRYENELLSTFDYLNSLIIIEMHKSNIIELKEI